MPQQERQFAMDTPLQAAGEICFDQHGQALVLHFFIGFLRSSTPCSQAHTCLLHGEPRSLLDWPSRYHNSFCFLALVFVAHCDFLKARSRRRRTAALFARGGHDGLHMFLIPMLRPAYFVHHGNCGYAHAVFLFPFLVLPPSVIRCSNVHVLHPKT